MNIWQRWTVRLVSIGGGLLGIIAACIGMNVTAKPEPTKPQQPSKPAIIKVI